MRIIKTIDLNNGLVAKKDRGPVPELRWIRIDRLRVDDTYQRPIQGNGAANVRKIVREFDWRMFAPVVVCPVEGDLYSIIDGQHRTTAALTCGVREVPCLVIQADGPTQAKAFNAINGTVTAISACSLYKARLAAEDPDALRVKAIGDGAGVKILTTNPSWAALKPRETLTTSLFFKLLKTHDDALITGCLAAAAEAAGNTKGLLSPAVIGAFVEVFSDRRQLFDRDDLQEMCGKFDLATVLPRARADSARTRVSQRDLVAADLTEYLDKAVA